ncbi:MAG: CocE/NonD family hydrolase [Pseudomonadota bacterium]
MLSVIFVAGVIIVATAAAFSHWRVRDFLMSKAISVPLAENAITIDRGLRMTTPDGVTLVADLYRPRSEGMFPTIVTRTVYGRGNVIPAAFAAFLARRGYIVLAQDGRGTGESDGTFVPMSNEKNDGAATLAWIEEQPWFNGHMATFGLSYLGFTAAAMAAQNRPSVKAVFSAIAPRGFRTMIYGTGGFDFATALHWAVAVDTMLKGEIEGWKSTGLAGLFLGLLRKISNPVRFDVLPIATADTVATGAPIDIYQTFVTSAYESAPYWTESSLTEAEIAGIEAPVFLSTAWHDVAMPDVIADYLALDKAGRSPRLTIGSGPHGDFAAMIRVLRDSKAWFDFVFDDTATMADKRVRFNVLGTHEWIEAESWPVPARTVRYYLTDDGRLGPTHPPAGKCWTSYVYDPMDPTPAVGGPVLMERKPVTDNAALEARDDTIVFSAPPFETDCMVAGEITASIYFEADTATADLFVRVNRVSGSGTSKNVTDAVRRIVFETPTGGVAKVDLQLLPTAVRFRKGERLRVLIASGAHPRIARNLGSGSTQEQAYMTEGRAANLRIHHCAEMPSCVELPVMEASGASSSRKA